MNYLPGNAQHIGARPEQQDSFAFSDPADTQFSAHAGLLALISDGMGGLSNGQQASAAAVRAFLGEYERKSPAETIPAALRRSLDAAFAAVADLNRSTGGQSGATLVAAVVHRERLYWVSVGDSRLYLVRRGRLVQLSRDHCYRERLLDQVAGERLALDEALSNPEQDRLTSYLGFTGTREVDANLKPLGLEPDDYVFLCTDGVYRALSDQEFVSSFRGESASQACESVKEMVLARAGQKQDNLTVIAFRCEGARSTVAALPAPPPAVSGLRSKISLGAVGLLLCANLAVGIVALKRVHSQDPGPNIEQKELGPSVPAVPVPDTPHDTPINKPAVQQEAPPRKEIEDPLFGPPADSNQPKKETKPESGAKDTKPPELQPSNTDPSVPPAPEKTPGKAGPEIRGAKKNSVPDGKVPEKK